MALLWYHMIKRRKSTPAFDTQSNPGEYIVKEKTLECYRFLLVSGAGSDHVREVIRGEYQPCPPPPPSSEPRVRIQERGREGNRPIKEKAMGAHLF
ncbi:hypothetical protein AAFF_G00048470 [Aldrovandia affinis]|uniref:Uncharacterized protein n=1 Tax=Aldrovandia affinis TaxID=143900 RepID=A0AAD7S1J4_9TELE|nr:hypothetical protein AAFF_G00048470 [Aldrovandia affinis]